MYSGKHDVLASAIQVQLAELDPAELLMVADYIRGLKQARNLRK